MDKLKFFICVLFVFMSCEPLEESIADDDSETQEEESFLSPGDTLSITHEGDSQALFYAIVADTSELTGEEYTITFENMGHFWILKNSLGEVVHSDSLFPATEEYYATMDSSLLLFYRINNTVTDGFIVTSRNATFIYPTTYSSAETIIDDFPTSSIVFGGIFPAGDGTWAGFLETTPLAHPTSRPGAEDLMLDIEFRFTESGSNGTYFNGTISVIEAITFPFEVWSVEEDKQIDAALYHFGGGTPLYEQVEMLITTIYDSTYTVQPAGDTTWTVIEVGSDTTFFDGYENSYKFTINFMLIPIYQDYTGTVLDGYHLNTNMGWSLRFNKNATVFEHGNVFRVTFINPIIAGEDSYIIESLQ